MVSTRKAAAAALAVLVLVGAALLWPTRERQVKGAAKAVAAWMSKEEGEGAIRMAQRASEAPRHFADPCVVQAEGYGFEGRFSPQDLSRYALAAWSRVSALKVRLYDLRVTFPERDLAEVTATARIRVRDRDGEPSEETHEITCLMARQDGRWLLKEARLVQVLER